jgi:hypothetical protein
MAHKYDPSVVRGYVDKFPEGTYTDFEAKHKTGMVPSNFTYIRRKYLDEKAGKVQAPAKKTPATTSKKVVKEKRSYTYRKSFMQVYSRIWFTSVEKLLQDPKAALADLVLELNRSGRMNCELVELASPNDIEIREKTK